MRQPSRLMRCATSADYPFFSIHCQAIWTAILLASSSVSTILEGQTQWEGFNAVPMVAP